MKSNKFGLRDESLFDSQGLVACSSKNVPLGKTFSVINLDNGTEPGQCADFGKQDFIETINCAHHGYEEFNSSTTAKERGAMLRRWHDLIVGNLED